ncbi:Heavy metal-associated domain, HMA [Artemisia annua]|uniref:Heavy metal-associated domain, HMA n=1 Tax=Artemisia annua TaxID=35608 RepID=A0A2U1P9Z4_ARTAN|nr:Heavy metal-associated domain, HMA [Artemisia annua]
MTTSLQIIGFHDCEGCTLKAKNALRKFGGVKLVEFDSENGKAIVSSTRNPEEIRHHLERKMKKPVEIVPQEAIVPINQNPASSIVSSIIPAQPTFTIQDLGDVVRLSEGLDSVEITHTSTMRITFNRRTNPPYATQQPRRNNGFHMEDVGSASPRHLPRAWRATVYPSAPPMSSAEEEDEFVYGYPPEQ